MFNLLELSVGYDVSVLLECFSLNFVFYLLVRMRENDVSINY